MKCIMWLYFFYFLSFQLLESSVNNLAATILSASMVDKIYSIGIALTATGYLCFAMLSRILHQKQWQNFILCVVYICTLISTWNMMSASTNTRFMPWGLSALFLWGYVGGSVHYYILEKTDPKHLGRKLGLFTAGAVVVQYLVQNLAVSWSLFILLLCMILCMCRFLLSFYEKRTDFVFVKESTSTELPKATVLPLEQENTIWAFSLKYPGLILILAACILTASVALMDGVIVSMDAYGISNVNNYTRFLYAIGLIVAGGLADYQNGKYLTIGTLISMLLSIISDGFLASSTTYTLAICCLYFFCGFYVVFFTITSIRFAAQSTFPFLWCGMGRICRGYITAIITIPIVALYGKLGSGILVLINILLTITLVLLYGKEIIGLLIESSVSGYSFEQTNLPDEFKIEQFKKYYKLTDKEALILVPLLFTERETQDIADELDISRRSLQRHISSLYEKTGTTTRVGLLQCYNSEEFLES